MLSPSMKEKISQFKRLLPELGMQTCLSIMMEWVNEIEPKEEYIQNLFDDLGHTYSRYVDRYKNDS